MVKIEEETKPSNINLFNNDKEMPISADTYKEWTVMWNPQNPRLYKTPEELQERIYNYFNWWAKTKKVTIKNKDWTEKIIETPILTITGLCLYAGFASRQSWYDYEEKTDFSYTLKKARLFIEQEYEEMLRSNPVWAIFALKNFGRSDRLDINATTLDLNTLRGSAQAEAPSFYRQDAEIIQWESTN